MKMKFITALCSVALFTGCASTSGDESLTVTTGPMVDCNLPTVEGDRGPIRPTMFVVGTFNDGYWVHSPERAMEYKGDGLYQLVRNEQADAISFQFASMNWKPQFSAAGNRMHVGQMSDMGQGGYAKDSTIRINEEGRYVWSLTVNEDGSPKNAVVAKCAN
ncbi:glycosidase [Vibrio sp. WXL210]|uniref:glycosidase n=1 Tax=Vibrio sp. WXL210 TaxID=3450709 RepID=UPI003EC8C739